MGETAVIVNEIGEIGIDHHILGGSTSARCSLASGCLCCTLRGDLADELRDLVDRRDAGEIPAFRRVVIETTGLADPTPIVNTLLTEPLVRHQYRLDAVVATVDAMHGLRGTRVAEAGRRGRRRRRHQGRPRRVRAGAAGDRTGSTRSAHVHRIGKGGDRSGTPLPPGRPSSLRRSVRGPTRVTDTRRCRACRHAGRARSTGSPSGSG